MTTLVQNQTANIAKKYRAPGGPVTVHGYGTWDSAQVEFRVAIDDGTKENYTSGSDVSAPSSALVFTADFVRELTVEKDYWIIMEVSSVGASTSLTISI